MAQPSSHPHYRLDHSIRYLVPPTPMVGTGQSVADAIGITRNPSARNGPEKIGAPDRMGLRPVLAPLVGANL